MRRRHALFLILPMLALTAACQRSAPAGDDPAIQGRAESSDEARAAATVRAMLAVAEEGRWDTYVDEYYGEAHKFGSADDRAALVERLEQQWGAQVIHGLRQAVSVTPVIDEEGRAVFSVDGQPVFVLYKSDDGHWTFHL